MQFLLKVLFLVAVAVTNAQTGVEPTQEPTSAEFTETFEPTVEPTLKPSKSLPVTTFLPTVKATLAPVVVDTPKTSAPSIADVKTTNPTIRSTDVTTSSPSIASTNAAVITEAPTVKSTISDITTSSPSVKPVIDTMTLSPTLILPSTPVKLPFTLCPVYQEKQVQCNGCQYCPDGSLCGECSSTTITTNTPTVLATTQPSVAPVPRTPTTYELCPLFNGKQVQCNGCQFCPDGSQCKTCVPLTYAPSVAPTTAPTNQPITPPTTTTPYALCPIFNGKQVQCNGCQFCPDGSKCTTCPDVTKAPTSQPVSPNTDKAPFELCPAMNGLVVRCSGCQYCPDGSLCKNCSK